MTTYTVIASLPRQRKDLLTDMRALGATGVEVHSEPDSPGGLWRVRIRADRQDAVHEIVETLEREYAPVGAVAVIAHSDIDDILCAPVSGQDQPVRLRRLRQEPAAPGPRQVAARRVP